jgi:hypothetical protein
VNAIVTADILSRLDRDRRASGELSARRNVVREFSPAGSACRIVHSNCTADEIEIVIRDEISRADARNYTLEWKVYGHDGPPNLRDSLLAAGFEPGDLESLLVLPVNETTVAAFDAPAYEIKRVREAEGLNHVADISREIGRTNVEEEKHRLATILRDGPDGMSVHVAYVDGEPAACGRINFGENSDFAELAGGRTKTIHRNRGLFTALVASRLREALERGRTHVFVDALPTSEPILTKRGFEFLTHTQPFVYEPRLLPALS